MEFIETAGYKNLRLVVESMTGPTGTPGIAVLIGPPGTGKTAAARRIAGESEGLYFLCGPEMGPNTLLREICLRACGETIYGSTADIYNRLAKLSPRLLVLDEANHLSWRCLEVVRHLVDSLSWSLLISGTELLKQVFDDTRTGTLLAQFTSRIGWRRVTFTPLTEVQVAAYLLTPTFGAPDTPTSRAFFEATKGYWRESLSLMEACRMLMQAPGDKLTREIVRKGAAYMTGRSQ